MQQDNTNNLINKNIIIADVLEDIALMFSMLEKGNLNQSLATIERGLSRIDEIAQETKTPVLRALTHWMNLNTEPHEDNKDKINSLLKSDSFTNWVNVLSSLLRENNQSLLAVLHQSLTTPDWPVKPSAPLLKSVASWIEEISIENEKHQYCQKTDDNKEANNNTQNPSESINANTKDEFHPGNVFKEIDLSILNKEYDDDTSEKVLKEIQQHPDFKESLIEIEKSSISIDDLDDEIENDNATNSNINKESNHYSGSCEEISSKENEEKSTDYVTAEDTDEQSDFCTEVDNIVMSLASIASTPDQVFTHTQSYLKELYRLSMLGEVSSISSISNLSDWCQRNIKLFTENQTDANKLFVNDGECWSWIELLKTCIAEPEDVSHLAILSTELTREEWLEPLDSKDLQGLLSSLRSTTNLPSDSSISLASGLGFSEESTLQQIEPEIPYLNIAKPVDIETLANEKQETSELQMTWDDDTHPELLSVYLEETPTQIDQLKPLMAKISQNQASKEEKHTASRMAHTIKGGSAIVGITALSEYAYKLETLLDFSVNHVLSKELLELLPESATCLEKLFDAVQSHQAEPSEFFPMLTKLTAFVDNLDEKDDQELELSTPLLPDFILNQNSQNSQNRESKSEKVIEDQKEEVKAFSEQILNNSLIEEVNIEDTAADKEICDISTDAVAVTRPINEDEINDFSIEIDDIIMTLVNIGAMSKDFSSNLDKYSAELQRFEIISEFSGYPEFSSLSLWCQFNLSLFAQNTSNKTLQFIKSGEAWTWLELIGVYLNEPEELSHLSALSAELIREEWPQPLEINELQALLLALRKSDTDKVLREKIALNISANDSQKNTVSEPESNSEPNDIDENNGDMSVENDVEVISAQINDELTEKAYFNNNDIPEPVISWDKDVHPELLAIYFQETPDQITEVAELLHKISSGKANSDDHKKAARIAHTIKGASGVVGLASLVKLTHKLEDILDFSVNNKLSSEVSELLSEAADCLESLFETIQNKTVEPLELPGILGKLGHYAESFDAKSTNSDEDFDPEIPELPDFILSQTPSDDSLDSALDSALATVSNTISDGFNSNTKITESHIRVPVQVIDKLLNMAGELVITSSQISDNLKKTLLTSKQIKTQDTRVHKMLEELSTTIYKQENDQSHILPSLQNSDFDTLEMDTYNELHSVAGLLTESILDSEEIENNLSKQLNELNDDIRSLDKLNKELSEVILSSRMVSLNTLVPRLERIIRQTCRKTGKQAELIVTGNNINLDADIINGLVDPLLHLLRNAIDHGIEATDIRKAKNKSEAGQIKLHFSREGNNILMQLKDDGAGIDPEIIYQKSIEQGLITPDQEFSTSDILKLILQPGFTTQDNISDISGRGVGMDVVNNAMENLKGTLQISSELDQGTTFDIKIPVTLVTNTTLLVRAGGNPVAISTDSVDQLLYLSAQDVIKRDGVYFIEHHGIELPIQSLADLLNWTSEEIDFSQSHTLLLIKNDEQLHALHIEEIIYSREVVIKSLNPWISEAKGVVGACHLNDGGVAPVLNLAQILKQASNEQKISKIVEKTPSNTTEIKRVPQILVVDDSLSNRKALSLIIDQTDYDVITAVDGLDALQIMNDNPVDMVFTDLEMPRMNGLELTQAIRAWNDKKNTPIVMITSRTTSKHRHLAEKAGVNGYLTKPVVTEILLESIQTWLAKTETV